MKAVFLTTLNVVVQIGYFDVIFAVLLVGIPRTRHSLLPRVRPLFPVPVLPLLLLRPHLDVFSQLPLYDVTDLLLLVLPLLLVGVQLPPERGEYGGPPVRWGEFRFGGFFELLAVVRVVLLENYI